MNVLDKFAIIAIVSVISAVIAIAIVCKVDVKELSDLLANSQSMMLPVEAQWINPNLGTAPTTDGKIKVINGVNQL